MCRELTKKYEEIARCSLLEAIAKYEDKKPLGEFVLIVEGRSRAEMDEEKKHEFDSISIEDHIKDYIEKGMDKKEAIKSVAKDRGIPKTEVYKHSIDL